MAGGLVYTALESTSMATAEIYGKTLVKLGEQNPKIVALTADLKGSTKIGDFAAKFPERTINVGIAEQNMYGMAAGLAKCGFIPFASSFSVFASLRALDQIHTDICYQNVNVKIIGTHGGTSFGQAGSTHHAIEDFAVIRSLVNMTLICPPTVSKRAKRSKRLQTPKVLSTFVLTVVSTPTFTRTTTTTSKSAKPFSLTKVTTSPLSRAAAAYIRLFRLRRSLNTTTTSTLAC